MATLSVTLALILALLGAVFASIAVSRRTLTVAGFYRGYSDSGEAPGLLTLTLSQVTTWIFARSLLNAAILGYLFGIAGTLAYAAYYLSFLVGGAALDSLRFRHGCTNIQGFLERQFGPVNWRVRPVYPAHAGTVRWETLRISRAEHGSLTGAVLHQSQRVEA